MMKQIQKDSIQQVLCKALKEISMEKQYQEKCLLLLTDAVQSYKDSTAEKRQKSGGSERLHLLSKYQSMVSSVLMATLPPHFPGMVYNCVVMNVVHEYCWVFAFFFFYLSVICLCFSWLPIHKEKRLILFYSSKISSNGYGD